MNMGLDRLGFLPQGPRRIQEQSKVSILPFIVELFTLLLSHQNISSQKN